MSGYVKMSGVTSGNPETQTDIFYDKDGRVFTDPETTAPVVDATPVADTAPVVDATPVADTAPVVDATPVTDTAPVVDATPDKLEAFKEKLIELIRGS